jgi:integrase
VVKARRPRPSERPIPSPEEVEKMILAAEQEDPLWGLFVNVSATIGTRRGETCALRWEDVDFDAGRLRVRRAVCKGIQGPSELKPPKTGRERSLFVGEPFFDESRPFRRDGGFSDRRLGRDGPWHPDWPGHRFSRLTRRLGLPYTLHSVRHFVATQLLARGLLVTQVTRFMGHKDPSVTCTRTTWSTPSSASWARLRPRSSPDATDRSAWSQGPIVPVSGASDAGT